MQPQPGTPAGLRETRGRRHPRPRVRVPAPALPYVRNYFKNERLVPALADVLSEVIARERVDLVHGQHVLTCLPSIAAAHRQRRAGGVHGPRLLARLLLVGFNLHAPRRDALPGMLGGHDDALHPAAWRAALAAGAADDSVHARQPGAQALGLAAADAIVAVSTTIAADLRARAPEIAATRLEIIPNPVDVAGLRAKAAAAAPPVAGPYALYLGKLAPNKGTAHLVDVARRARPRMAARGGRRRSRTRRHRGAGQGVRARRPLRRMGRSGRRRSPGSRTHLCSSFRRAAPSRSAACSSRRVRSGCQSPP